jgi:hypothetical protein
MSNDLEKEMRNVGGHIAAMIKNLEKLFPGITKKVKEALK